MVRTFMVVLTVLLLSACGQPATQGGGTPAPANPSTSPGSAANEEAEKPPEAKIDFISIGTAPEGASFYAMGVAYADLIKRYTGINSTAEPTGASGENIRLMESGDAEYGFVMAPTAMKAVNGEAPFDKEMPVQTLFVAYEVPFFFITSKRSGVDSWEKLAGAKIMGNPVGSVDAETMFNGLMDLYGLTGKVNQVPIADVNDAAQQVIDGAADGIHYNTGAAIQNLTNSIDVNFLSIDPALQDKYRELAPGAGTAVIPAGTLPQQDKDVVGTTLVATFMADKNVPEEVVYESVKAIFEHLDELEGVHPFAKQMNPELAVTSPAPYHPGAIRYFKEIGVWPEGKQ